MDTPVEYDARYLTGIRHFNAAEYFDAHEVWEDLWNDCDAADRRFYQSLIQAAVALYHGNNGNAAGAHRLFHSGKRYMTPYRPTHNGLQVDAFWNAVELRLGEAVRSERATETNANFPLPQIVLSPEPIDWPESETLDASSPP